MQAIALYPPQRISVRRRSARQVRRARTLAVITLLVVSACVLVFAPRTVHTMTRLPQAARQAHQVHIVASGETLWEIAAQVSNGRDIRLVVAEIKRTNRLQTARVFPGQTLQIPAGTAR